MAEFIEVRATVEGQERAAALVEGILRAGLATSVDLDLATSIGMDAGMDAGKGGPIRAQPLTHDIDDYPARLTGHP